MDGLKNKLKSLFMIIFFLSMMVGFSNNVSAISIIIEKQSFPALTRSWENVTLLYDNYFHNSSDVYQEINRFHDLVPELIDIETFGQSYQGKDLKVLKITNELRNYQKAKTLVVAHHHGREQISVEAALRFIIHLLNSYQKDEVLSSYIDTQEIYVIPMLNPDALDIVINEGNHWLRKNVRPFDDDGDLEFDEDRREDVNGDGKISSFDVYNNTYPGAPVYMYSYYEGIDNDGDGEINEDMVGYTDLNRNYDAFWREGGGWDPDPISQVFPGPTPFSEPETQAFRDFALQHRFAMAYSLHSGINATFFTDDEGGWTEPYLYRQMIDDYREILPASYTSMYYEPSTTHKPEAELPYVLSGSWDSWMYQKRGTIAPITFELYRNLSSILPESETIIEENSTHQIIEWTEIYGYFTPEKDYINALWEDVKPGFDYLLANTPRLGIEAEIVIKGFEQGDDIGLSLVLDNLSPRIETMDRIGVYEEDLSLIKNGTKIYAIGSYSLQVDLILPHSLEEQEYVIKIGNEYVGFTPLEIKKKEIRYGLIIGLSIAGVVLFGSGLGIYFLVRRR
ncbi:MAG: hypothetical protein H7641_13255 [Candidatus Heimdallarchaeota archaeon]|nr:hypothetical protein [Candidatus Heimdallarchaeota archaeon]MCK4878528.1 hypothetical protein [Candidatus Heimdallarchaeota archaeon]